MAFARITLPPQIRRGDPLEIRLSIRHPMETGFRIDEVGHAIPRNTLRSLICRYNDVEVFRANLGSGIAANPYLRFFITAAEPGTLSFDWIDDAGERGQTQTEVRLTG